MKADFYYVQVAIGALPCDVAGERLVAGRVYVLSLTVRELAYIKSRLGHYVTIRKNTPLLPVEPTQKVEMPAEIPVVNLAYTKAELISIAEELNVHNPSDTKRELIAAIRGASK